MKVVTIVEGDGEVPALPVLLRRIALWKTPGIYPEIPTPIRVRRERFLNRDDEFVRYLRLAASKCSDEGWILILLDADDDCPAQRAPEIATRARALVPNHKVSVVLANREYEAWFIAAAESLNGERGFAFAAQEGLDAEAPRDAKGWIRQRMAGRNYSEILDQPAFSAIMNLEQAFNGCRSFRKLCREWVSQCNSTIGDVGSQGS